MRKLWLVSWSGVSDVGGVERVMKYVMELCADSYEVVVVDDELLSKTAFKRILHGNHTVKSIGYSVYVLLHRKKGDLVISNGFQAACLPADYLYAHGCMPEYIRCSNDDVRCHVTTESVLETMAAHCARRIICVAHHTQNELHRIYHVNERKMIVIQNPVNTDVFFPIERKKAGSKITVLFVGRLTSGKGEKELLKLSDYLEKADNDMQLMIVSQSKNKKSLFRNKKNTVFICAAPFEKLNEYYNEADVMFFLSKYEGFEMVTLESLSAGVPVVGNKVGAISELADSGAPGVYVLKEKKVEQIALFLREVAETWKSYAEKERLHQYMEQYYGLDAYRKKIMENTNIV